MGRFELEPSPESIFAWLVRDHNQTLALVSDKVEMLEVQLRIRT